MRMDARALLSLCVVVGVEAASILCLAASAVLMFILSELDVDGPEVGVRRCGVAAATAARPFCQKV